MPRIECRNSVLRSSNNKYPASYPAANIVTVGATGLNDAVASFSNFGSSVHMSAPGVDILSTTPLGTYFGSGTSEAAPHVTGAAALLWAAHPQVSLDAMRSSLVFNGRQIDKPMDLERSPPGSFRVPASPGRERHHSARDNYRPPR
ncbi:MAG: S8 family serine peptidase [Pyrinomonadaceae bacterium]|nr:S8 family serine peptidase [Pyrinomonadaceae bacterium]